MSLVNFTICRQISSQIEKDDEQVLDEFAA
jgi:hypothetical protein